MSRPNQPADIPCFIIHFALEKQLLVCTQDSKVTGELLVKLSFLYEFLYKKHSLYLYHIFQLLKWPFNQQLVSVLLLRINPLFSLFPYIISPPFYISYANFCPRKKERFFVQERRKDLKAKSGNGKIKRTKGMSGKSIAYQNPYAEYKVQSQAKFFVNSNHFTKLRSIFYFSERHFCNYLCVGQQILSMILSLLIEGHPDYDVS